MPDGLGRAGESLPQRRSGGGGSGAGGAAPFAKLKMADERSDLPGYGPGEPRESWATPKQASTFFGTWASRLKIFRVRGSHFWTPHDAYNYSSGVYQKHVRNVFLTHAPVIP